MLGNENDTETVDHDNIKNNFDDHDVREQLEDLGYM